MTVFFSVVEIDVGMDVDNAAVVVVVVDVVAVVGLAAEE